MGFQHMVLLRISRVTCTKHRQLMQQSMSAKARTTYLADGRDAPYVVQTDGAVVCGCANYIDLRSETMLSHLCLNYCRYLSRNAHLHRVELDGGEGVVAPVEGVDGLAPALTPDVHRGAAGAKHVV